MFADTTTASYEAMAGADYSSDSHSIYQGASAPKKSAFLSALAVMDASMALDPDWSAIYDDDCGPFTHMPLSDLLQFMGNAPDAFLQGVIFGKIATILDSPRARMRQAVDFDPLNVSSEDGSLFMAALNNLKELGQWTDQYEDCIPVFSTSEEFDGLISEFENLLRDAPTPFSQGVMFGKIINLQAIRSCMRLH